MLLKCLQTILVWIPFRGFCFSFVLLFIPHVGAKECPCFFALILCLIKRAQDTNAFLYVSFFTFMFILCVLAFETLTCLPIHSHPCQPSSLIHLGGNSLIITAQDPCMPCPHLLHCLAVLSLLSIEINLQKCRNLFGVNGREGECDTWQQLQFLGVGKGFELFELHSRDNLLHGFNFQGLGQGLIVT